MALILGAFHAVPSYADDSTDVQAPDSTDPKLVWEKNTSNGVFSVTLDPQLDTASESSIEINQFLEWQLTIKTADGQPVSAARVTVSGGMPMHGHGLPSQPQVIESPVDESRAAGNYLLKGLMFSMNGRWTIALDIQSKALRDNVIFEVMLDH